MVPTRGWAPTKYQPAGNWSDLASRSERNCRRIRLRSTAPPTFRPMAKPTWAFCREESVNIRHHSPLERTYVPSLDSREKTSRWRIRPIKPKACVGLWRDGTSKWRGRHGSSYDGESHASWHDGDYLAGKCVSRTPPRFGAERISTTLDEQPIGLNDGTTTARTLQAKLGFLCLWKTCYLRFPRLVSAGVSTPCGQCCGRHMTRVPLVGNA